MVIFYSLTVAFACAVDIVGVAILVGARACISPYDVSSHRAVNSAGSEQVTSKMKTRLILFLFASLLVRKSINYDVPVRPE